MGITEIPIKRDVKKYLSQLVEEISNSELRLLEIQLEFHEDEPLEHYGAVERRLNGAKTLKISWVNKKKESNHVS